MLGALFIVVTLLMPNGLVGLYGLLKARLAGPPAKEEKLHA